MYAQREETREQNSRVKDLKIEHLGKSIELPEAFAAAAAAGRIFEAAHASGEDSSIQDLPCSSNSMFEDINLTGDAEDEESKKRQSSRKPDDSKEEDRAQPLISVDLEDSDTTPTVVDPKALSTDTDVGAVQSSKIEDDESEPGNSHDKTLKKPDKILPCPRCNSTDTKFCYFNNYNVNQPRHLCKNCQRYWTAGGTMRKMPVGAGRRKSKSAASQLQHLTVPALQSTRVDLPNGIHYPMLNPRGSLIAFTSDTPPESVIPVLNIVDQTTGSTTKNVFNRPEDLGISHGSSKNGDNHTNGSLTTVPALQDEEAGLQKPKLNCHPFPPHVPCFPGAPWPYPWHPVSWSIPPSLPTFPSASFPLPFCSTAPLYWGCAIPGAWSVPWAIPPAPPDSSPNSQTLGKHSRDDNTPMPVNPEKETRKEGNAEKCLWVPKTLRICDPGEAAKSSIWATLGIKNDRVDSIGGGGGLFKAFQSQSKDEKTQISETSAILQANPAALSRSLNFRESS